MVRSNSSAIRVLMDRQTDATESDNQLSIRYQYQGKPFMVSCFWDQDWIPVKHPSIILYYIPECCLLLYMHCYHNKNIRTGPLTHASSKVFNHIRVMYHYCAGKPVTALGKAALTFHKPIKAENLIWRCCVKYILPWHDNLLCNIHLVWVDLACIKPRRTL